MAIVTSVPDHLFSLPRLAEVYDPLDPDRDDLEPYVTLLNELGARSVLDIGCGTGTFAVLLAGMGFDVVAVDPAEASLAVARRKPDAERVSWVHGTADSLPELQVDAVTMTGNVAQVFLTDKEWAATLRAARQALRPGGYLIFETRDPAAQAWRSWTRETSYRRASIAELGDVESWVDVTEVAPPMVSFRSTFRFVDNDEVMTSTSTLRFRDRDELVSSLRTAGFEAPEIREAPDRPSLELVVLAPQQR